MNRQSLFPYLCTMNPVFHTLKIAKKVQETADATTFYLEIPTELKNDYAYTAGQYLTFKVHAKGEEIRRSYSLCTYSGVDAMPGVTVKRVEGGKMSNYMPDNLKVGDEVEVMTPNGKFTVVPEAGRSTHYVLFAGGSGITPMMGITKAIMNDEPNSKVTLVYANRNPESVIFKTVLAEMEKFYNGKFKVIHNYDSAPLTWFGLKGFLTEDKIQNILQSKIGGSFTTYSYYICGPSPMMDIVKKGLGKSGVPPENVHTEYFAAPVAEKRPEAVTVNAEFDGTANVTVTVFGKTKTITCDKNTTVLNAALKQGIDPPYSCTVGVCTTCRAKVHKGVLHMMEREGLTDDEINQGYVLTCQAVPRSAEIELTYE